MIIPNHIKAYYVKDLMQILSGNLCIILSFGRTLFCLSMSCSQRLFYMLIYEQELKIKGVSLHDSFYNWKCICFSTGFISTKSYFTLKTVGVLPAFSVRIGHIEISDWRIKSPAQKTAKQRTCIQAQNHKTNFAFCLWIQQKYQMKTQQVA